MIEKEREFLRLIFNPRVILEILLVVLIPFFDMGSNTLVERLTEITHNYAMPNFLIITFQMFFSLVVLTIIYLLEKKSSSIIKQLFVVSVVLSVIAYFIRIISFSTRGIIGVIFSNINIYSSFGIETVFIVAIPVVKILSSFFPFLGILLIVFLRSAINIILVLPLMSFSLERLGLKGLFITLYISQFIIIFLFAKLPYYMSKMSFKAALKESIFRKDKHFSFILIFSSIYAFITTVSILSLPIFKSKYVFPAIVNFIAIFSLMAFFAIISKEETYERRNIH